MRRNINRFTDDGIYHPVTFALFCSALDNQELVALWQHAMKTLRTEEKTPWTVAYCAAEAYVRAVEKEYAWRGLPRKWLQESPALGGGTSNDEKGMP